MYTQTTSTLVLLALLFATVFAAPLNINMGAYSPSMVVGDGAIAFSDANSAKGILGTLEGADADGTGAAAAQVDANSATLGAPNVVASQNDTPRPSGLEGLGRKVVPSLPN
ncbi:hypothetical protein K3495_g10888 [Podosphaera aphanis]|nr:hypothetical protein K3495_g10888 [Podosphaera aphanis]